ncbi:MAG: Gfo/Idh/MocA family protein [Rhodospirillaceae bacterium]
MASPPSASDVKWFRLALIGAGVMGANYIRAVQSLPDVRIVAVVDPVVERANRIAAVIGARAAASLDYAGEVDGAIVAVPSADHRAVAEPLLARGIPCLIEKPFALNETDCRALIAAAAGANACLQIGHVERFNAAVQALLAQNLKVSDVRALAARRLNAGSARVLDIDVVMDLMVHDIDVVLALKRTPVTGVHATGTKDHAVATLAFDDGTAAQITSSRVTEGRTRDLTVEMTDGAVYALDYVERSLTRDGAGIPVAGDANSLGRQMADFAHAVRTGRAPQVGAEDALRVMKIAWRVQKELGIR